MDPKFVILIAHGLNLNPDKMKSFLPLIKKMGGHAEFIRFHGHEKGEVRNYNNATQEHWHSDIEIKFQSYLKNFEGVPLYYLGFSMGALAGLSYLHKNLEFQKHLKKQIFLAPAFKPHAVYEKIYRSVGFPNLWVPSLNSHNYNVHRLNSLKANNEIFRAADSIRELKSEAVDKPTLVFLNSRDELISYKKSCEYIHNSDLKNWHVLPVKPKRNTFSWLPQHLIIDERSLGSGPWAEMQMAIEGFLAL